MDNMLMAIIVFFVGTVFGWIFAHSSVATECEKLHSFYLGDRTFQCEVRK